MSSGAPLVLLTAEAHLPQPSPHDVHTTQIFKKSIVQILVLAFVAVGVGAFLTALVAKYVFPYNWNWYTAMALGSILSATDPVAVVSLLKDLNAPRALTVVITGTCCQRLSGPGPLTSRPSLLDVFNAPAPRTCNFALESP